MTGRELIHLLMDERVDLDIPILLRTPDALPDEGRRIGDHLDWELRGARMDSETYDQPVIALTDFVSDDD